MKKLNLLIVFVLPGVFTFGQDTISSVSTISDVIVFKEGAQIKRTASKNVQKGRTTVILTGMTSDMDINTIKVSANKGITVVSVIHRLNFMNKDRSNKKINELKEQLESLVDSTDLYKKYLIVLKDEKSLLKENKKIGGSQNGVDIENLKATSEFYRSRMKEIELQILSVFNKIRKFNKEIIKISRQLNELNVKREFTTSDIIVVLSSEKAQNARLNFEYFVNQAGWKPYYDIRVADVNDPVKIIYKAKIFQNTDIDWENVKLTLSTGNPSVSGFKPILNPYILSKRNYTYGNRSNYDGIYSGYVRGTVTDDAGDALPGVSVFVKGTTIGTMTLADGSFTIDVPFGSKLVFSYIGMETAEQEVVSSDVNMRLRPSSEDIGEVVVTALGVSREKKSLGYGAQYFSGEDFEMNTNDIKNMLGSRSSGVNVSESDISVGSSSNISIRGAMSHFKNGEPLFVIDGQPIVSAGINSGLDGVKMSSQSIDINPDDIESVSILKGGSASALYGGNAANGVVLITTKKSNNHYSSGYSNRNYTKKSTSNKEKSFESIKRNVIPLNMKKNQTNREFIIDIPYTIRSDNKEYDVAMTEFDLQADYRHHSVPKLSENVFLTALITDYEDFGMLNGEANIFFKETYTGKTFLDLLSMTDTINLSLGIDNDVIIKREQIKDFTKSKNTGSLRKDSRAWKITVKNMKEYPIDLMIEDQLPMANNSKIKVDKIEISNAKEDEENGKLEWVFKLEPLKNKELLLKYSVRYPSYLKLVVD